jgi:hypothetical protein
MEDTTTQEKPAPPHLPKPTVWPAVTALGISFLLWGLVSSLLISLVGAIVFAVSITGWIGDIRHERKH